MSDFDVRALRRERDQWKQRAEQLQSELIHCGMVVEQHKEDLRVAQSDGWIPVEERSPENWKDDVLVCSNDGPGMHPVWIAGALGLNDPAWIKRNRVTHWKPLPNVPKDEP